ncbi:MAG: hypothetical protein USCAAHI_00301 [Beijerinckiaceae bacterium]|nr:MAG: hypothetical protein USCAAHI_00301 [Beijerinckiaceae bacterium]
MVDGLLECFYIPRNLKALEIFVLPHFLDANQYPLRLPADGIESIARKA